jgi:hypothetical protein
MEYRRSRSLRTEGEIMARINSLKAGIGACGMLLCLAGPLPRASCSKKPPKTVTTANGGPVRKVFISAASPDMASSAATQLTQDTCLTAVADPKQADAVLDVGIALPDLGGGGSSSPGGFGSSARPHTLGGANNNPKPQRTASATCSDGKGSTSCSGSYSGAKGGLIQPAADWPGNAGTALDVSLASSADASQELWEPNDRSKKSWSDQLRAAAGCPVCPGEHFNRKQYPTYRQWIQAKCPAVLAR